MSKVHLFDYENSKDFPNNHPDKQNIAKCGYVRDNVTSDKSKVTCKLCLREIEKDRINSIKYCTL